LGVLKEKKDDDSSDSQDNASDVDDHEAHENATETGEGHVMARLLGIKPRSKEEAPGIREVEDG
jgi:hypothetical protein